MIYYYVKRGDNNVSYGTLASKSQVPDKIEYFKNMLPPGDYVFCYEKWTNGDFHREDFNVS